MRTFLFNGDSNVAGCELANPDVESMAAVISERHGARCVNLAKDGASNDRIYDTTLEYLRDNPAPDFVMIGWTEHGREQWYHDGRMYEINDLEVGERVPEQYRRRHQFWKMHIKHDTDWHRVMGYYWHNKIYNLHIMLKEKNIPHYFFNAFFAFHGPIEQQLDWHGNFYQPYAQNRTYINWCQEQGYREITPGWLHFNSDAHKSWADELVRALTEDKVL